MRYRHLAIFVPELRGAEAYYREIFHLDVIVREARAPGSFDEWGQAPARQGMGRRQGGRH